MKNNVSANTPRRLQFLMNTENGFGLLESSYRLLEKEGKRLMEDKKAKQIQFNKVEIKHHLKVESLENQIAKCQMAIAIKRKEQIWWSQENTARQIEIFTYLNLLDGAFEAHNGNNEKVETRGERDVSKLG